MLAWVKEGDGITKDREYIIKELTWSFATNRIAQEKRTIANDLILGSKLSSIFWGTEYAHDSSPSHSASI